MQKNITVSLANVTKRFGEVEAVKDVSLHIATGEIVGFVGPNGAGKTTTIALMMGALRATKGTISMLGTTITPASAHRVHKRVGFVAGDMVLPETLTGAQFLTFTAAKNGRHEAQYDRLVSQLNPVLDRPLKTLSRGNKQKIALISALQHAPEILIMDEPTSGLDPLMQEIFLSTVQAEAKRGTTVLMSSHILSEVTSICSRIIFMKAGRFIMDKHIDSITSQLGRQVTVTSKESAQLLKFMPDYVTSIASKGHEIKLVVPTDKLKPFLRWLIGKNFEDLSVSERDLEEVFHELYVGERKGRRR